MRVSDFEFELPAHLIAKYPTQQRSASRLLHLNVATGAIGHYIFTDLVDLLVAADLLVFNNTRVIPARLFATKSTGGKVVILLERVLDSCLALVQIKSSKSPKPGARLILASTSVELAVKGRQGHFFVVQFPPPGVVAILQQWGHVPLPPYITRADEALDLERYQTVFAKVVGAVAAPTAGLHFDTDLIASLQRKGISLSELTLHVGAGTFQPVRVTEVEAHQMHPEQLELSQGVCNEITACQQRGGRVVAVGTTSVRSLETAAMHGVLQPFCGTTDIFIYPGYEFQVVDAMVTNFHLPGSTLMMLVSAFAGVEAMQSAYAIAIEEQYRFFSYGDAMLITR